MKKIFTLLLLTISIATNAQLTNGLVANWNFNGNTNDISGNGLNGTPTNISYTTGKNGVANTAALFNGKSSFVSVPFNPLMNTNTFTICAMIKVNGFYAGACQTNAILWRGSQYTNGYYSLIFFENPFDNSCQTQSLTKNVFATQVGIVGGNGSQWRYTPTIDTQKWYCVVSTFDGKDSKIYVDGVLKSTFNSPNTVGTNNEGLGIGKNNFSSSGPFPYWLNAAIDDLRLYNRVLSKLEIDSFCDLFSTPLPEVYISQPVSPTSFCPGNTFQLNYAVTAPFNAGNTFTAQLSNAAGNFGIPVNIGSVIATAAGTINCTIPANTPPGFGYRVRVVASNPGQTSTDNGINLTVDAGPTINLSGSFVGCLDDKISILAQILPSGATYSWTGPNGFTSSANSIIIPKASYADSGLYIITANYLGCTAKDTARLVVTDGKVNLGPDTTICSDEVFILDPKLPGAKLLWQDGSTANTYTVTKTGVYTLRAQTGSCVNSDTINIKMLQIALALSFPEDTSMCPGESLTFSVPDTFDSYKWSVPGQNTNTITFTENGRYWLRVTKGQCTISDSISVGTYQPEYSIGGNTTLCNGQTITLKANSIQGSTYRWQDGSTNATYLVYKQGIYEVTAYNLCGEYHEKAYIYFKQCECNPFVPNAFTPNRDGLNDAIKPILDCMPLSYHFMIANRWGQIVFNSNSKDERWDGRFKEMPAELGNYYYYLKLTDELGVETEHKGDILLLR